MGKTICIMNQKGGVGKTTTTANLGVGLKNLGKKVLLIDLDPQANLTSSLGLKNQRFNFTIYQLLKAEATFEQVCIFQNGVSILPSSVALSGADLELSNVVGREILLKEALANIVNQFDAILIDCPPTLGLLALNALTAADGIIIPIQAEYLPLEGLTFLLETVDIVKKRLNSGLEIAGVLVTMYDARKNLQREVAETIQNRFAGKVFETLIRSNVSLAEAPSFGQDIFTYKPNCSGAIDYDNLSQEIIERGVI